MGPQEQHSFIRQGDTIKERNNEPKINEKRMMVQQDAKGEGLGEERKRDKI